MISTLISNSTIKIFLSSEEMTLYKIKFDDLDKEKYETKVFILNLIEKIKNINNIDLSNEKLYIEAFEQNNGSCLLYISIKGEKFKKKDNISTEIVYEFKTLSDVTLASKTLWANLNHLFRESDFLCSNENYRLIIKSYSKVREKIRNCLCEYGKEIGTDDISISVTREHYTMIIEKNAIESLAVID
ncbi:MAG: adaptor protein MecA [Oscillospiraceae bacterium]|nr:adaptor protein MecA [Oscillospiraceae bacterium]